MKQSWQAFLQVLNGGMMRDTVVKPGDIYKVFLRNDTLLPHAEVLSIDDNWVEFAVLQSDRSFVFEIYPKDMIKKMQSPEDTDKKVWVLKNDEEEAKFTERTLSESEIDFSRIKNNTIILDSRDDAIEYIKDLKDKENNPQKAYKVQTKEGFGYESM